VLFTIEAQLSDGAGGYIPLTLVAHQLQDSDAPGREDIADTYIEKCTALGGGNISNVNSTLSRATLDQYGSSLMVIDLSSTPPGIDLPQGVYLALGSVFQYQVAYGDVYNDGETGCYQANELRTTGVATGITNYETGNSTSDPNQWVNGNYGFYLQPEEGGGLTACSIEFTDLATAAGVDAIQGWNPGYVTDTTCLFGNDGE
jgi:hypothetical protein